MNSHAILHPNLPAPDWFSVSLLDDRGCADAVKAILSAAEAILGEAETRLETFRERIFNIRMVAFRIVSDRELWKMDIDPEYGVPFKSMPRWMATLYPEEKGLRYAQLAQATQKALPEASIVDLGQLKQCNAVLLAKEYVSPNCRKDKALIEAAKTESASQFKTRLNMEHAQALEEMKTLAFELSASDYEIALKILREYGEEWNATTPATQLIGILVDWDSGGRHE